MDELTTTMSPSALATKIQTETDQANLDKAIQMYNLAIKKCDIARTAKLSEIQDNLVNELILRSEDLSEMSVKDLLEIFKVAQSNINSTVNAQVDTAPIIINQQQINVGETLNRESRKNITNAVSAILAKYGTTNPMTIIDAEDEVNEV